MATPLGSTWCFLFFMCYHSSHPSMLHACLHSCAPHCSITLMKFNSTTHMVPNQHPHSSVLNTRLVYPTNYNFSWIEWKG